MTGKIIRAVAGFYYVDCREDDIIYQCRARGIFRKDKFKPLTGDNVLFSVTDSVDKEGSIDEILPRKNALLRPPVANVDQALIICALASPPPGLYLLDRFLVMMRRYSLPVILCFNKTDLVEEEFAGRLMDIYKNSGCTVIKASIMKREGLEKIRDLMRGKTTVLAGASGVGKSSLTNYLVPDAGMEVGELSRKTDRGKQTTRHAQLFALGEESFFLDTPGFSSLSLDDLLPQKARDYFPEFSKYEPACRFQGCMHRSEPDCAVKQAVEEGHISRERYDSYLQLLKELEEVRRY